MWSAFSKVIWVSAYYDSSLFISSILRRNLNLSSSTVIWMPAHYNCLNIDETTWFWAHICESTSQAFPLLRHTNHNLGDTMYNNTTRSLWVMLQWIQKSKYFFQIIILRFCLSAQVWDCWWGRSSDFHFWGNFTHGSDNGCTITKFFYILNNIVFRGFFIQS